MKKLQLTLTTFLLFCCLQKAAAQFYFYNDNYYETPVVYELGGSIGLMNCLTDLGGNKGDGKKFIKDINLGNTQFAGSIFASATYKNAICLTLEATFGQVKAYDSILKNVKTTTTGRYERNLSFKSSITEIIAAIEIHPLFIFNNYNQDKMPPQFSPYLLVGIGYFSFNPQAKLLNNWIDLQPLSTEGQGFAEYPERKIYQLHQLNIPVGAGIKYELSPTVNLRAAFVYRFLFTDYLDDASTTYINPNVYPNYFSGTKLTDALILNDRQNEINPAHNSSIGGTRGNPKNNDAYFSFNIKIGIVLGREKIKK